MRIAFLGPLNFDRWTLFISTYFTALARALVRQGHTTRLFSYYETWQHPWFSRRYERSYAGLRARFGKVLDLPYEMLLHREIDGRLKEYQPDGVLLHFVGGSYYPALMRRLGRLGAPLFAWLGINPEGKEPFLSDDMKQALQMADCVLYYDPAYRSVFRAEGFQRVRRLPFGIDFGAYDSLPPADDLGKEGPVAFIGQVDALRGRYLRAVSGFPLGIWTYDRSGLDRERLGAHYRGEASGDRLIQVLKAASICLNIHRPSEISGGNYRLFEIAAARSCQLVDARPGIAEYLQPGEEVLTFHDVSELRSKTREALASPDLRHRIAEAAYRRARRDHSIDRRAQRLVELFEEM